MEVSLIELLLLAVIETGFLTANISFFMGITTITIIGLLITTSPLRVI